MISRMGIPGQSGPLSGTRRGNTLILVAGMLVLLVIIATVFLSRTQSLREAGRVQRQRAFQRDRTEAVALDIAQEIADALFVREIDYTPAEFSAALPPEESRREALDPKSVRYGVDPDFAWNRAPWDVTPWTNPPDWLTWPLRPGPLQEIAVDNPENPEGRWDPTQWTWADLRIDADIPLFDWPAASPEWPDVSLSNQVLQPRENPLGGPGTSDTRWLRDIEPQRVPSRSIADPVNMMGADENPFMDRSADALSHWRHLSYIGRPGNGWRMCPDIADVTGTRSSISNDGLRFKVNPDGTPDDSSADGRSYYGGIVQRLDVPIEQWPAMVPTMIEPSLGFGQVRLADNWTVDSGDGFHWGDTATSVFLPETDDVMLTPEAADMTQSPHNGHRDFWDRWLQWLRPEGYKQALAAARRGDGTMIPPNFYDLSDLDGDGVSEYYDPVTDPSRDEYEGGNSPLHGDPRLGESDADEFIPGTARWHVNRILTDTDGDGFTDSFWWLSPHIGMDDTRQIIGVSVTDNSGRINGNVATRFERQDDGSTRESSRGWTPAATALVSQNAAGYGGDAARDPETSSGQGIPVWNTGFFDIELHQPWLLEAPFYGGDTWDLLQDPHPALEHPMVTFPGPGVSTGRGYSDTPVAWNANYWRAQSNRAWIEALNIDSGSVPNPFFPEGADFLWDIADRDNRLYFFQESGQASQHPQNIFTPFGLADEFELRAHEGNNTANVYSRVERALGGSIGGGTPHILRAKLDWPEQSQQLDNRQLASDLRHRMTFFSAARNETRPPHLWWSERAPRPRAWLHVPADDQASIAGDRNDPTVANLHERFFEQARLKLDLREYERPSPPEDDLAGDPLGPPDYQPYGFSDLLAHHLMLGLTSGDVVDRDTQPAVGNLQVGTRDSYFGKGDAAWEKTRRMAAAMAANMIAMRDPDSEAPLYSMEMHPSFHTPGEVPPPWIGDQGAVPLPLFEQAYAPDRLAKWDENPWQAAFADGARPELFGNALGGIDVLPDDLDAVPFDGPLGSLGSGQPFNWIDDYIDLSDATFRGVRDALASVTPGGNGTAPPVAPWDVYEADVEWIDPEDPNNTATYQDDRLFAEHDAWRSQYSPEIHELGVEAQPFIAEAFVAVVGRPWMVPEQPQLQPGENQQNEYEEYENAGLWTWATSYQPSGSDVDGEWDQVVTSSGSSGAYLDHPDYEPEPPRVVFAVQLINPYDVPIPLLDQDGQPIYSLNLFRGNRHDPNSPPRWVIPLDPRGYKPANAGQPHNGTLIFDAATSIDTSTRLPDGDVAWDSDDDTVMDSTPVIPPATNDRPFSLTIIMNGLDDRDQDGEVYDFNDQPFEAARWLDFLDAERDLHPSSDADWDGSLDTWELGYGFPDPHLRNWTRWIAPGELLWSIRPNHSPVSPAGFVEGELMGSNVDDPARSMPSLAKFWYGQGVGGGAADNAAWFPNPPVDPRLGVGIELVRHHKRDWNRDGVEDPYVDGGLNDYGVDVVIDRTVGPDGIDEFAHAVTTELARHRQPSINDSNGISPPAPSIHFDTTSDLTLAMDGGDEVSVTRSWLYPRALDPDANSPDSQYGYSSLSPMHRISPEKARWMQWARYSRAWAADDYAVEQASPTQEPTFAEAEYATNLLGWDGTTPVTSRRWRPDRAAPRFVASDARVTRSWAREWAAELGELPNLPAELDVDPDGESVEFPHRDEWFVSPANPAPTAVDPNDPKQWRVLRYSDWESTTTVEEEGPQVNGGMTRLVVATEDPLLTDLNLGKFEPYDGSAPLDHGNASPLRLDRRAAEQKGLYAHKTIDTAWTEDVDDVFEWRQWGDSLDTPGQAVTSPPRDVRVLIVGDPEADLELPRSDTLFVDNPDDADLPDFDRPAPFDGPAGFNGDWGAGWYSNASGFGGSPGIEVADTYSTLLRYRHGHIYSTDWDPDGLGRVDADNDGRWDEQGNGWETAVPYTTENPYPYPWATRNVRLPWSWNVDDNDDNTVDAEYRIFQASKPCFFGFTQFDREPDSSLIRNRDAGYDQLGTYDSYAFDWSYPDKGWYGPSEIDGDVFMPHAFQVQPKNANFEQVGEVLNALTVAHELYLPLKTVNSNTGDPDRIIPSQWWEWPPEPAVPSNGQFGNNPASGTHNTQAGSVTVPDFQDRIATLRTFSEGLSDRIAEPGDPARAGRLLLAGSQHGPNAIVGDPYHQWYAQGGDAAYDLRHIDFDGGGFGAMDPMTVPHWYLRSTDLSHMEPDLPASQRLLDMFVCDGPGIYDLVDNELWVWDDAGNDAYEYADGLIDDIDTWPYFVAQITTPDFDARNPSFDNAGGFERRATNGMININTAPAEVLRSMPHMHRLVHADPRSTIDPDKDPVLDGSVAAGQHDLARPISPHPRSAVADAIVQFRDGLGDMPDPLRDGDPVPVGTPAYDNPRFDLTGVLIGVDSHNVARLTDNTVTGVADGPPYTDRGAGLPFEWWGGDNQPDTADDYLPDLDQYYDALGAYAYNLPSLQDVNADDTVRYSRGERGFAGIGELFQLTRPAYYDFGFTADGMGDYRDALGTSIAADAWRMDWAGRNPFGFQDKQIHGPWGNLSGQSQLTDPRGVVGQRSPLDNPGSFLSTDTGRLFDTQVNSLCESDYVASGPGNRLNWGVHDDAVRHLRDTGSSADPRAREVHLTGDRVAGDAEEHSLLFSGISNIVTTRSDIFTVHLRIRTFRRDAETDVWDATDPKNIVDDARYVMVVDRSEVDHPGDRPRILMMQRIDD